MASAGATRRWSALAWVHARATTRRLPTASATAAASCGASVTSTSRSSPSSHTLLSTSKV